jgi:hypothetical protein
MVLVGHAEVYKGEVAFITGFSLKVVMLVERARY